jgi:RecB family endonuclease NucS
MVNVIDMSIGMIIGMILAPIMMKGVKKLLQEYRINKILKKLKEQRVNEKSEDESNKNNPFLS